MILMIDRTSKSIQLFSNIFIFKITFGFIYFRRGEFKKGNRDRPMSSAHCSDKEKYGFSVDKSKQSDNKVCNGGLDETWYKEVIALRKKAGEYKVKTFL